MYAQVLRYYERYCEQKAVEAGGLESLSSYLAAYRQQSKLTTVVAHYRVLHAYFAWLVQRGYLVTNPAAEIDRPHVPRQKRAHVTPAEFRRLYASISHDETALWLDHRDRAMLVVLFYSGLRVNEAMGLQTGDVDLAHHLLTVHHGKGGHARMVPCAPLLAEPLMNYLYTRPPWQGAALWVGSDGCHGVAAALGDEGVRMMLRRRCAVAGLRYMHPHLFRHGFAMALLNAGMNLSAVAAAMGHSSQSVTEQIYAHWQTDSLQREYIQAFRRLTGEDEQR
jgi:site-specific recombinase XerD